MIHMRLKVKIKNKEQIMFPNFHMYINMILKSFTVAEITAGFSL